LSDVAWSQAPRSIRTEEWAIVRSCVVVRGVAEVLVHHRGEIVDIFILEKINAEEQLEVFACGIVEELRHGTLRPWLVGLSNVESKCVKPDRDGFVDVELSMSRTRVHCPNLENLLKLDEPGRISPRTHHIVGKHGFGVSGMSG